MERFRVADTGESAGRTGGHTARAGGVDFTGTLVRLHIGLENSDDLIDNLAAGFARIVQGER